MRYVVSFAVLLLFLSLPFVHATAVTVDIYGTNVSNAQSNLTQTGNNSYQILQWAIGDTTKSLKADNGGNVSDDMNFTLHNFTAWRVVEVKVNSSSFNSYQADSTGTISFTRTQTVRNQTYSFTPAVNAGGYNFTWAQFWTFPFIQGTNLSTLITNMITAYNYIPYTGATADLDMNNKNITGVHTFTSTTTNTTTLNATNMAGNGSEISYFNLSNGTGVLPNASVPLSAMNQSQTWINAGRNVTVAKEANNTYTISAITGVAAGSYTGDGTINRTIAHGLGKKPKLVLADYGQQYTCKIFQNGKITIIDGTTTGAVGVVVWDATNFYVGAADQTAGCNINNEVYYWVAWA